MDTLSVTTPSEIKIADSEAIVGLTNEVLLADKEMIACTTELEVLNDALFALKLHKNTYDKKCTEVRKLMQTLMVKM